jgi:DNA polymerase III sliding clamp (beta) subunit (PCNA family)
MALSTLSRYLKKKQPQQQSHRDDDGVGRSSLVSAASSGSGETSEIFQVENSGRELTLGFDATYLSDFLSAAESHSSVRVIFWEGNRPAIEFRPVVVDQSMSIRYIVSPCKV